MQGAALIVLDGWGLAPPGPGNCVRLAKTPVVARLEATCPRTTLLTSGRAVGLPEGQMGNSEVGHLTLGSGRVIAQDLVRITEAIEDGSFFEFAGMTAMEYAGDGQFSFQEDIYNRVETDKIIDEWKAATGGQYK